MHEIDLNEITEPTFESWAEVFQDEKLAQDIKFTNQFRYAVKTVYLQMRNVDDNFYYTEGNFPYFKMIDVLPDSKLYDLRNCFTKTSMTRPAAILSIVDSFNFDFKKPSFFFPLVSNIQREFYNETDTLEAVTVAFETSLSARKEGDKKLASRFYDNEEMKVELQNVLRRIRSEFADNEHVDIFQRLKLDSITVDEMIMRGLVNVEGFDFTELAIAKLVILSRNPTKPSGMTLVDWRKHMQKYDEIYQELVSNFNSSTVDEGRGTI